MLSTAAVGAGRDQPGGLCLYMCALVFLMRNWKGSNVPKMVADAGRD